MKFVMIKTINLFAVIALAVSFLACASKDKSVTIHSYQFKDKEEKLKKLREYVVKESGITDAEYHIWIKDNGGGRVSIPGPSDYTITLALKIMPDSLNSWTKGLDLTTENISIKNWERLELDQKEWMLQSVPELYQSKDKKEIKLIYRREAAVLAIYSTTPISTLD